MVLVVLAGVFAGGAVFTVLDRPFARDRRRHSRVCEILLTLSVTALVVAAAVATRDWLAAEAP
jgi:hypothetical protein